MRINVAQLKVAAENAIIRAEQAQIEYDEALARKEHEHFLKYKANIENWRNFYTVLGKALRKSATEADIKAVTHSAMPTGTDRFGNVTPGALFKPFRRGTLDKYNNNFGNADHSLGPRPVYEVRNLQNLLDFLSMVEDEVITSAMLEKAGFRNIAKLMDTVRNGHWTDAV